jgi:L-fuconolactonase
MLKIDSHQHFWKFDEVRDSWITDDMAVLRNDFLPEELGPILAQHGFDGCVVVQSDQSPSENVFQLHHAARYPFVKGVVGWVDLQATDIADQLSELSQNDLLKGFRHILQGDADRALMLKPAFVNGVGLLKNFGFTYDILILPDQLQYAAELAAKFPDQAFVLDHIAKPDIKNKGIKEWAGALKELALHENVYCKLSGMVTEADWGNWRQEDFVPYMDVTFEAFGAKRLMYGSDWPVSLLAADYGRVVGLADGYVSRLSINEQELFWGGNAIEFYNLK